MQDIEFMALMDRIRTLGCESNVIEIKEARGGCPQRLYDTYSSFSNQNEGGTIIFGLKEEDGYSPVGVYDASDLMKRLMDIGEEMSPVVRPLINVFEYEGKIIVTAVIPPMDVHERPCFWKAKGRLRGSFVRVGDGDKPMTEYEVYSYEVYRRHMRDELRTIDSVIPVLMDERKFKNLLERYTEGKPNLASLPEDTLYQLSGLRSEGKPTLLSLLMCGIYPQSIYPQLSIIASRVPGKNMGCMDSNGKTFFLDSKRIEGTLDEMIEGAMSFVGRNMKNRIDSDKSTGMRVDLLEYPLNAIREAVINAVVHRDYSVYSEGRPIQLIMFDDRMEIHNPGGIYGGVSVEALGYVQPESRNRNIITLMELLGFTENRYSGIPKMKDLMRKHGCPEPVFESRNGEFIVTFYNDTNSTLSIDEARNKPYPENVLLYCMEPRSRKDISEFLEISSTQYAMKRYIEPLVESGAILLKEPDTPRSRNQEYFTNKENTVY